VAPGAALKTEPIMAYEQLGFCVEGEVCTITLDNPEKGNALSEVMIKSLHAALTQVRDLPAVKVVVLTGAGKVFCTGGDVSMFTRFDHGSAMDYVRRTGLEIQKLITETEKVFVAKVNGYCLAGGLELALCCDLIYANDKARFGLPEINLGILPGWGGTTRLPRSMPVHRARELIFTGRIDYAAEEMSRLGLLTRVFPYRELDERVGEIVTAICTQSLPSLRMAKTVIAHSVDGGLDAALAVERGAIMWLAAGDDARARIAGFAAGQG
jgi:enoyl-CoA hydratase/carnithine racemase